MASGWELEGLGFEPWHQWLKATFDPRMPKKQQLIRSQNSVLLMIKKNL